MQSDGAAPATLPPTSRTAAHAWGLNRRQPKRLTVSACQMLKQQSGMLSAMRVQCMEGEVLLLLALTSLLCHGFCCKSLGCQCVTAF